MATSAGRPTATAKGARCGRDGQGRLRVLVATSKEVLGARSACRGRRRALTLKRPTPSMITTPRKCVVVLKKGEVLLTSSLMAACRHTRKGGAGMGRIRAKRARARDASEARARSKKQTKAKEPCTWL